MTMATWTPERLEQLRNFAGSGLSSSRIAAEIGVTRNAVIGKLHRLGLAPGRPAAGGPARTCPPRAHRPRHSPQREFLRLMFAQVPSIASGSVAASTVQSTQPCSLFDLARDKCRWPMGNPEAADFAFCGNEAATGFPYCAGHARLAYRIPVRQRA
jgi:GcrA cell cycle regulator